MRPDEGITSEPPPPSGPDEPLSGFSDAGVALSILTALTVSATTYVCAWQTLGRLDLYRSPQYFTYRTLKLLSTAIDEHAAKTGKLPASLSKIPWAERTWALDADGNSIDGWQRPLHYEVDGDTYQLYSLGADNRPGGEGLDADLYADQDNSEAYHLTLLQFAKSGQTLPAQVICLLSGLLAFPLCLLRARTNRPGGFSVKKALIANALTAVFAVGTALVICIFDFSSGH